MNISSLHDIEAIVKETARQKINSTARTYAALLKYEMTVLASELAFASTNDTGFSGDIASCIEIHQSDNDSISSEIVIACKMDAHDELLMQQCLQNVAAKLRGRKE